MPLGSPVSLAEPLNFLGVPGVHSKAASPAAGHTEPPTGIPEPPIVKHLLSEVNLLEKTGYCQKCLTTVKVHRAGTGYFYCANARRNNDLLYKYNLTLEQYDRMYEEAKGICSGCEIWYSILCVDHDHDTGETRGLLCSNCNTSLGLTKESIKVLQNLIKYIKKWK